MDSPKMHALRRDATDIPRHSSGERFRRLLLRSWRARGRVYAKLRGWWDPQAEAERVRVLQERAELEAAERIRETAQRWFPDQRVQTGPFAGMLYTALESHGSSLLPKLAGAYECELHPVLERFSTRAYGVVVDVGSAEGYYAVGLALLMQDCSVLAFDISKRARELTSEMASGNGVAQRVLVRGEFDINQLRAANQQRGDRRGLMILDVEGAEEQLLHEEMVAELKEWDLIIECHDFLRPGLCEELTKRLRSHQISTVDSISELFRPVDCCPAFARDWSFEDRFLLLNEGRPAQMRWLICERRA